MQLTFLGHQGWAFQTTTTFVLLDPLEQEMGNGARRLPVWPKRRVDLEALPPVSGLVISHEHSDHFDLSTLYRLPYRGVVYIPELASAAMRGALTDLGFTPREMKPFERFEIGGLRFTPLGLAANPLELEVQGLLVTDASDNQSSFLTLIDGVPDEGLFRWLASNCPKRSIDNFTNNFVEPRPQLSNINTPTELSYGKLVAELIQFVERFRPKRVLLSGQGWCYTAEQDYLNHELFAVDNDMLLRAGELLYPSIEWLHPAPGTTLSASTEGLSEAPFVRRSTQTQKKFNGARRGRVEPWSGARTLSVNKLESVLTFVRNEFGALVDLHSPRLMQGLHTLRLQQGSSLEPTLFLRVRNGSDIADYKFDPGLRKFVVVDCLGNPAAQYSVGCEVWATDLLSLIEGEEEAFFVYETAVRRWCHYPELLGEPVCIEIFSAFSPRYRSSQYLRAYRARLKDLQSHGLLN